MKHGDDNIIINERASDARYRTALRNAERDRKAVQSGGHREAPRSRPAAAHVKGLLGRVALAGPTDFFDGTDFYIGTRYHEGDGLVVFGWAAPIASTFFQGFGRHELCSRVTVRRTLLRRGGEITGYIDDGPARGATDPFARRELRIPKAPSRRPLPGRAGQQTAIPPQRPAEASESVRAPQPSRPTPVQDAPMRAERAVLASISAPRQERLTSVLATLQPDQYELVTAPSGESLVIEGHPGTGKTVVAAHRAAYLVHEENKDRRRRVLVVGPTEHYVEHVHGVLSELIERTGAVEVLSLERVLRGVRGIGAQLDQSQPAGPQDVDDELGDLAERTFHLLRDAGRLDRRSPQARGVEMVYEALRTNRVGKYHVTQDAARALYLRSLPNYRTAQRMRRYLPLLAACGMAVAESRPHTFDHVIVDEAQDLTPLEWSVLRSTNPTGAWTLLGDLNQRRSDLSFPEWKDVASVVGKTELPVVSLGRGYRTSAEIMAFASRLLPASERTVTSLQQGGLRPQVERERSARLYTRVAKEAALLLERHARGTVAIIDMKPQESLRALRKMGFTVDARRSDTMCRAERSVRVLTPHEARGLEFDASIVVEPISFPSPIGSHGLLYTSLTRANKELVVLHTGRLPKELRERPIRTKLPQAVPVSSVEPLVPVRTEPVLPARAADHVPARLAPELPSQRRPVSERPVQLLVTGAEDWHDGVAVREMLQFALTEYGAAAGASLVTFGSDGAEAIARRAWLNDFGGPMPPTVLDVNWERDGWAARNRALQQMIDRWTAPAAVLGFVHETGSSRARTVMKFAVGAGIPAWRWSERLGFPVPAGNQIRTERWHPVMRRTLPAIVAADPAVQHRALRSPATVFCDEMEDFDLAACVPSEVPQGDLLRQLLARPYHRRSINRSVAVIVWGRARALARTKPLFFSG